MISSKVGGFSRSVVGVVLLPLHFSKGGFNLLKGGFNLLKGGFNLLKGVEKL